MRRLERLVLALLLPPFREVLVEDLAVVWVALEETTAVLSADDTRRL